MSIFVRYGKFIKNLQKQTQIRAYCAAYQNEIYWNDKCIPGEERFSKILIANRGEISCRIIDTCRRIGIKTVAIHSDIDSSAKFVEMADEAYNIGAAPVNQSYLNMQAILDVVKKTGAEAVHPGYGFLSENMKFAKMLEDADCTFIGPTSASIQAMGDKIQSKRVAEGAGVNMIPGYDGEVKDEHQAVQVANDIGYPVMIKASAGGGGRGLRIAWNDNECRSSFKISKTEAASAYGDDRMLLEKYIDNPRHIEVQVMCDQHGNAIHLNERECSIQRRNQKVIEEAPSTFLDPETRAEMGAQAVMLAKSVGYSSAGTVEFLVDSKRKFYFLEMNTRLQVEHPITECITGIDIVHQMLRSAKGHKLVHTQADIGVHGWAVECRVYAEDPYKNFGIPSIGRLSRYSEPLHLPRVRCDSGITEGTDISIYYDSMICKLVTWGADRESTLARMAEALDSYVIRGLKHNIPLLRDIITEDRFVKGNITTKYLPEVYPQGFNGKQMNGREEETLVAIAACVKLQQLLNNFQTHQNQQSKWRFQTDLHATKSDVLVSLLNDRFNVVVEGGEVVEVDGDFNLSSALLNLTINGSPQQYQLMGKDVSHVELQYHGTVFRVGVMEKHVAELETHMPVKKSAFEVGMVVAPMSGMVKSVAVKIGDVVSEGQEVLVLEAMKMQNSLVATIQGKIKKINAKVGVTVVADDILVEME